MPRNINPIKKLDFKNRVKRNPNKPITEHLREMGETPSMIHNSTINKYVKVCLEELKEELKEKDVNVELIIRNLNQDRNLAQAKGDIATMTRVDELLGKYLAMFKDVSRSKVDMDISDERRKEIELLVTRYNRQPLSSSISISSVKQ